MLDNGPATATPAEALARRLGLAHAGERLPTARVRVHGHEARLVCRLDAHEHGRRFRTAGRRLALADWGPLNLLMALPYEEPVPLATLSTRERGMLPRLPYWTHELHAGHIRRIVRPPLRPVLAVVAATRWSRGLDAAATYASFCAPVVEINVDLDDPFAPMEAADRGVGLVVDGAELVAPAPSAVRQSATSWWLAEHAYWRLEG
ncbi:hypothetical protein AB0I28_16545 [Phytomonospora sp. NPDC050363]|uniref:hypothetical protein n=1 Tax=Phytomonospora sp. NPDC050363 TaxID=3155642 RepID=UPI0033CF0598